MDFKSRVLELRDHYLGVEHFHNIKIDEKWLCDTWLHMHEALEHYETCHYTHDNYPCVHDDTARKVLKALEQGDENGKT